ncbi:mitochondrial genome maintenance protein [Heterostelium album PN500]|uniref:Mitochondrial genome maintenance protein n=1 Tax=Heterostelium pallidum (strain ATCC 26659 / Pp 5 / PN500) TaxID=670386 RepID=D3B675_HETP5|nr:mitochondrial genome maintenance protein [Heterostelium album PN500]EFA83373.1 mitochondrial genome maintenance protein [Heterostelium album PN500]|eukprot:XP_020435490.1 mitochondrial genome maintenance protein [Heterostelium album PN500]
MEFGMLLLICFRNAKQKESLRSFSFTCIIYIKMNGINRFILRTSSSNLNSSNRFVNNVTRLTVSNLPSTSMLMTNNNNNNNKRTFATNYNNSGNSNSSSTSSQIKVLFDDEKFYQEEKYHGISKEPFAREISDILLAELNNHDIEIKPDGMLYLPEIKYRRILNQAFGPGGWALKPMGPPIVENQSLIRPYALYCLGRYISESIGEQPYSDSGFISFATATEAAKSNALVRCCKDLGIGSSLWDPNFIRAWKQQFAIERFYENVKTKEKKKLWTTKSNPAPGYPWRELNSPASESALPPQETIAYQGQEDTHVEPTTTSSSSSSSNVSNNNQQQQNNSYNDEEIDVDSVVPPQFKKYSGKTWRDVINDPKGIQYIQWASQTFSGKVQLQAKAIYDWIEQNSNNQQQ